MQVPKAGAAYFALVFAVGFVLGTIRTLWLVPRVGTRTAELMEMPLMLAATILAARRTLLRLAASCGQAGFRNFASSKFVSSRKDNHGTKN
jgi:hypothetical protein